MMRIKLFYDERYNEESVALAEEEVNEFISDKDVIDIKFTSEGAENGHSNLIMVLYKEETK